MISDLVFLLNSMWHLFRGKIKSYWTRPFLITEVFPYGAVELEKKEGEKFTINGQRIQIYVGKVESLHQVVKDCNLDEV